MFRFVKGVVGFFIQVVESFERIVVVSVKNRDTHAASQLELLSVARTGVLQGFADFGCFKSDEVFGGDILEEYDKLVAAYSSDNISRTENSVKFVGHRDECFIALRVAEIIVYQFEVVKIHDEKRMNAMLSLALNESVDMHFRGFVVQRAGERIPLRAADKLFV